MTNSDILGRYKSALVRLQEAHAEQVRCGDPEKAKIYARGATELAAQIASYTSDGHEDHFLDGDGTSTAMRAFSAVSMLEAQVAVEDEIVETFRQSRITSPRIMTQLVIALIDTGADASEEVRGLTIRLSGNALSMVSDSGDERVFSARAILQAGYEADLADGYGDIMDDIWDLPALERAGFLVVVPSVLPER